MIEELAAAKSPVAVVWPSEAYAYDERPPGLPERSPFDVEAARLYPRVIARFGFFEVRAAADAALPAAVEPAPR
jgi:hypothetical protein